MKAEIFDIQRSSYVDGPGIRTTVFFKGCNLRCAWCHNPESQACHPEIMFYRDKCVGCGKCAEVCPNGLKFCTRCGKCESYCLRDARKRCGREYTADEILAEVIKDKLFYDNSGGGVTFSGGECMLQIDFLEEILKKCRAAGIHTAVDTAGHVPFELFERILPYTDLFLYDFKCFDGDRHKEYTGVDNALILENLARLLELGHPLWVRIPVIPEVNGRVEEMERIRAFIEAHGHPENVELLPYHSMGEYKYAAIGREVRVFTAPSDEEMTALRQVFDNV